MVWDLQNIRSLNYIFFIIHGAENDTLKWCLEYICFYYFLLLGKVRWKKKMKKKEKKKEKEKKKKSQFLKKNVDDTVCFKNTEVTDQGGNTRGLRAILARKVLKLCHSAFFGTPSIVNIGSDDIGHKNITVCKKSY